MSVLVIRDDLAMSAFHPIPTEPSLRDHLWAHGPPRRTPSGAETTRAPL